MRYFNIKQFILLLLIFFLLIRSLQAKSGSFIVVKGMVTDSEGVPLPFANIYIKGRIEGAMSDEQGRFSFQTRAVGTFTLVCSYVGYQTFEKSITLKYGETIDLNIILQQRYIKTRPISVLASAFTAAGEEGVTLTAMDVVRTPGAAADLFWAIKTFPGVQQVEEGAGLFVRGGDVSETLVLLDGAIINHPYKYESPTGGFFGTFSPFLLKGTFFSSGGYSAQYGNGLSGVLCMESHDLPSRRQMGIGIGLAVESVYLTVPIIDDRFGFSLSGNHSNTKMMFELNKNRKNFSQYPLSFDVNINTVYQLNAQSKLKFFLFHEHDKVGVEIDDPDYATHFYGNSSNQLYNLKFSSLLQKKFLLQANVAFNHFKRSMRVGVMDIDIEDRLYQARITGEGELLSGYTIRAGLAFFRNHTLICGTVPQEELDLSSDAPIDFVETKYLSNRAAQFFELEAFTPLGLKIIPGLRGEYESISKKYCVDTRISLVYPLTVHSSITAAFGNFHQYPEPRYYDSYTGNPELVAMKAAHTILGYAYKKENKIFRVEGYYKDYKNLLLEDKDVNYMNFGRGYSTGVDVFVKNSYGPVSGWISYSWLKARRKWMDLPILASPYFDITNNLTVVFNAALLKNFSMGVSFRYATGKPYTPAPEKYHEARVPDYRKLDVNFSYLHSFFESNMTVFYIAASNVLGRINIFDYRYSSDYKRRDAVESSFGRSVYFGISFNM